jgi:hypothetical protein
MCVTEFVKWLGSQIQIRKPPVSPETRPAAKIPGAQPKPRRAAQKANHLISWNISAALASYLRKIQKLLNRGLFS